MKKILFIAALFVAFTANAQVKFGITGGVNFAQMKLKEALTIPSQNVTIQEQAERGNGFHIGVVGQVKVAGFFLQPEVLYNQFSTNLTIADLTAEPELKEYLSKRLDIPVLFGKSFSIFKVMLGPVASYNLSSDSPMEEISDLKDNYKDASFGYQFGLGAQASNLFVELRYEGSLSKFGDGVTVDNQAYDFDRRINQVYVSVGWFF